MTKKQGPGSKGPTQKLAKAGVSRRDFFTKGAAASVGVVGLGLAGGVAQAEGMAERTGWDHEADVVVLGSGGVGLAAAVRARDLGASVIVLEQNYDVGGKMAHSGGWVSLGGGDHIQERDRLGLDPDNLGLGAPVLPAEEVTDDPDTLFRDMTDWSVVNDGGTAEYRYNDPELLRAWADNAAQVRRFMSDNYVRWSRITGSNLGSGMSKARAPWAIMKIGDSTDIEAGTITIEDKGDSDNEKNSPFNPMYWPPAPPATAFGAPGYVFGGFVVARSLEYSARKKGVQFMVNRHMDTIIREGRDGRVLGVTASYSPRYNPETGERLESWWNNGNIEDKNPVIHVRARKGVIVGTGGWMGNVNFRTMFDPRLREPSFQYSVAVMGDRHEDASGIIAGMKVGAALAGLYQGNNHTLGSPRLNLRVGTSSRWDATFPGHPAALFVRSAGVDVSSEWIIAVNQVGQRIYDESSMDAEALLGATYPPGMSGTNKPFRALDWNNSSIEHVRRTYAMSGIHAAALGINEGSRGPDFTSGPVWAIFDQGAVDENGWEIRPPYIADPPDGFFFRADTLAELSRMVIGNPYQHMHLTHLEDTVARYNASAEAGQDDEFGKPIMHKIETGPFYAALMPVTVNDSYGGLRINGKTQVVDLDGNVIPGLYAGGEASGGGSQHGIGRAAVQGYMAGTHAALESGT
ncbi:MAG: FAD-binding protein [Devosia sp.]|uniref:FAD-dependent oxidoreductase n=1 Tax=Devosia sp. TaxID=1871048 RepID=UPI0026284731|nr:FAD-dependent oxidoreductase [Devosia sp.]MDB5538870.1 FAD-binding protein [Devosia sp.]